MRRAVIFAAVALLAIASGPVFAGGGHGHSHGRVVLGLNFGFPAYVPWYAYPAPVYYYPPAPVYMQPPAPTQYIERGDTAPEGPGTWYFCREANTYYPYVKHCPGGWSRVPAQPPS
jgi:hypothetical protein